MIGMFFSTLRLLFAFFPASIQALIFGIFGVILLFLAIKLVATILKAIPFL